MTVKTLLAKASKLTVSERAELIDGIWASFSPDEAALADDWFNEEDIKEWDRRSDELGRHPERALTWEQVKARAIKR